MSVLGRVLKGFGHGIGGVWHVAMTILSPLTWAYAFFSTFVSFIPKCFLWAYDSVHNTKLADSYISFLDRTSLVGKLSFVVAGIVLFLVVKDAIKRAPSERQRKNDLELIDGAEEGNLDKVKTALKKGANIHANSYMNNDAALLNACIQNHLEIVKYLVDQGADFRADDDKALRWASQYGNSQIVDYLVSIGCDAQKIEAEQFLEAT